MNKQMKRLNNKLSYTLYFVLVAVLYSCVTEQQPKTNIETYKTKAGYRDIEIVEVRDCEYVLWHNGYGSDMEHYEGCKNTKHYNAKYKMQCSDPIGCILYIVVHCAVNYKELNFKHYEHTFLFKQRRRNTNNLFIRLREQPIYVK